MPRVRVRFRRLIAAAGGVLLAATAHASPTERFVVGPNVPVDGVDTFGRLADALFTAGLATGAVIQIEPGALASTVTNTVFSSAQIAAPGGFTIRGNPGADASEMALVMIVDEVTIGAPNVRFENLKIAIERDGRLLATGDALVLERNVIANHRASGSGIDLGGTLAVVRSNRITAMRSGVSMRILAAATSTTIADNQFDCSATANLVSYDPSATPKNDVIERNTFRGAVGNSATALLGINGASNILVRDNDFVDHDFSSNAISVSYGSEEVTIAQNRIAFEGPGGPAISAAGGLSGVDTSITISGNDIRIPLGVGMFLAGPGSGVFAARVEGNRVAASAGVLVAGLGPSVFIDLGDGPAGSLGANVFRGVTEPATPTTGAIVSLTSTGTAFARDNAFAGDPETAVFDQADDPARADVDTADALTGNAAYVASLYPRILGRVADLGDATDAGAVVAELDGGRKPADVVRELVRSEESREGVADQAYRAVLRRAPTDAERESAVTALAKKKEEDLIASLYARAETRGLFGSDAAFVSELFQALLGRTPTADELAANVAKVGKGKGRAKLARTILKSAEFATVRVTRAFRELLHREPAAEELAKLRKLDRLSLLTAIAASEEFRTGG